MNKAGVAEAAPGSPPFSGDPSVDSEVTRNHDGHPRSIAASGNRRREETAGLTTTFQTVNGLVAPFVLNAMRPALL